LKLALLFLGARALGKLIGCFRLDAPNGLKHYTLCRPSATGSQEPQVHCCKSLTSRFVGAYAPDKNNEFPEQPPRLYTPETERER